MGSGVYAHDERCLASPRIFATVTVYGANKVAPFGRWERTKSSRQPCLAQWDDLRVSGGMCVRGVGGG